MIHIVRCRLCETCKFNRSEIPQMSPGLLKKFQESIFEFFSNAVLHSKIESGIFNCGQFYPGKDKLVFVVADLGVGINVIVCRQIEREISAVDAIIWAVKYGDTTIIGGVPGDLGASTSH